MIGRLGKAGDEEVVAEAKTRFSAHCQGSKLLPADLRHAVSPLFSMKLVFVNFFIDLMNFSGLNSEKLWIG